MKDNPMQDQNTRDLIGEFAARALERADHELTRRGNELSTQLQSIAKELIRRGAEAELLKLTENPNTAVRFYAAESCYDIAPEVTRRVFEAVLADDRAGFFQHLAKTGLMIRFVDFLEADRKPLSPKEEEIQDRFFDFLDKMQSLPPKPPSK